MLAVLLLAGIVAAPLRSAGLFVVSRWRAAGLGGTDRGRGPQAGAATNGSQPQTQYGPDAQRLLRQADAQQRSHPTYYGGAWDALGAALLTSRSLSPC